MIKNIFITVNLLMWTSLLIAQSPFNKLYDLGYIQNNAYAIEEFNGELYIAGQMFVRDPDAESSIFFAKFTMDGELNDTIRLDKNFGENVFF